MTMNKAASTLVMAMIAIGLTSAHAEEKAPLFPLPFTPDFTGGSGWGGRSWPGG